MSEIHEELKRIAAAHGGVLTAEDVVKAAEPEDSVLHGSFEWDDTAAARQWRLHTARQIILRVKVSFDGPKEQKLIVRAWHSLTPDREEEGGGYREAVKIMRNTDMRAQLLIDAKDEMDRFEAKYAALSELSEVFAAMRRVK